MTNVFENYVLYLYLVRSW